MHLIVHFHKIPCVLISYLIDFINRITQYYGESILIMSKCVVIINHIFVNLCYEKNKEKK